MKKWLTVLVLLCGLPVFCPAQSLDEVIRLAQDSAITAFQSRYEYEYYQARHDQFEALRKQKAEMTRKLRALSHTDRFEETLRLLMTVPGIGQTTGLALMAEIVDVTRFDNAEQLAAYVGMIPMCHSSGEHEGVGDITLRKHAILRSNVIEAAWVAIRKDETMQLCYLNNCKRMVPSKAIVKVARKLVNRIYFVLKRHQPYVKAVA